MMTHRPRLPSILAGALVALTAAAAARAASPEQPTFEQHVRPILKAYCLDCHGAADRPRGKLDLRLRRFLVRGGASGPAVVPGNAAASLLLERLQRGEMPPGEKKVPAHQVAVIRRWVAGGARTLRVEPDKLPPGIPITEEERAYWLFQPLRRPAVPPFAAGDRVRTPIDAFVLVKLREKGLSFNPDAGRLTLLRRASLDLLGLLPGADDVERFLSDRSPDAYERMVDRLLASPAYGERWGRHWLDVAGYADSDGGAADRPRPDAWRYRDYVIRSLNADKPFDRFLVEQLAGDELVPRPWNNLRPEQVELLTATGFLRTAPDAGGGGDEAQQVVADTLKIFGSAVLGLSVGCAQCHDHRYDPIPQADYFRLRAVFEPALDPARWRTPQQRRVSLYTDADRARAAVINAEAAKMQAAHDAKQARYVREAFEKELAKFPAEQRGALQAAFDAPAGKRTAQQSKLVGSNPKLNVRPGVLYQYNQAAADELKKLQAHINAKRAEKPAEGHVAVLDEVPGQVPTTRIFYRGDHRQPRDEVRPGDLTIAAPEGRRLELPVKAPGAPTSGRRLAYARHLTSGAHPLVGRALANRIWLYHMGRGIVDTPGELGVLGQRPTHPELLDYLACELPRLGWSLKRMHRLILTSTVYRQSSRRDRARDAVDAGNAVYGRFGLRRLEAEVLRDCILAVAGRLDRTPFGPSTPIVEDAAGQVGVADDRPRRSIYLEVRRSKPVAFLGTFDAPVGELSCDRRTPSTAATQALMLMNSDFILRQADHFARRVIAETAPGPAGREKWVVHAWRLAYQRPPSPEEMGLALRFLQVQAGPGPAGKGDAKRAALTNLCHQLLASNELLHVD
jgi:hypothetical protein